jgi:hypothetical protein
MQNNFDLKKYLIENKLTRLSENDDEDEDFNITTSSFYKDEFNYKENAIDDAKLLEFTDVEPYIKFNRDALIAAFTWDIELPENRDEYESEYSPDQIIDFMLKNYTPFDMIKMIKSKPHWYWPSNIDDGTEFEDLTVGDIMIFIVNVVHTELDDIAFRESPDA